MCITKRYATHNVTNTTIELIERPIFPINILYVINNLFQSTVQKTNVQDQIF